MKLFKFYIVISIAIILSSCGTIRDGFSNQKKNNSDEFLVEKKSPLLMPPDFDELPIPNSENTKSINDSSELKEFITKSENTNDNSDNSENSKSSFEKLLIEKIKN